MTQHRKHKDRISNYFDRLLAGIGHRGSSFTDIDAMTHDERTDRYLFQEFKWPNEPLTPGQKRGFKGLAEHHTVWCVRKLENGMIEWCDVATRRHEIITTDEYRQRFARWWANEPVVGGRPSVATAITAADISW